MLVFGFGAAAPLVLLGSVSRRMLRIRGRVLAARQQRVLGVHHAHPHSTSHWRAGLDHSPDWLKHARALRGVPMLAHKEEDATERFTHVFRERPVSCGQPATAALVLTLMCAIPALHAKALSSPQPTDVTIRSRCYISNGTELVHGCQEIGIADLGNLLRALDISPDGETLRSLMVPGPGHRVLLVSRRSHCQSIVLPPDVVDPGVNYADGSFSVAYGKDGRSLPRPTSLVPSTGTFTRSFLNPEVMLNSSPDRVIVFATRWPGSGHRCRWDAVPGAATAGRAPYDDIAVARDLGLARIADTSRKRPLLRGLSGPGRLF